MSQGLDITDAYGQPVFSTDWATPVLGGSTNHSGTEKVSVSATTCNATYIAQLVQTGNGGIVDFRIEDTSLTDSTDTPVSATILPFINAPVPVAVTHVFKAVKSGAVNAIPSGTFNANASATESSVECGVSSTPLGSSQSRFSSAITGMYVRSNPGVNNPTDLPNCGTLTMAKRNRMVPHLFVGDQFQFGPIGDYLSGTVAGRESVNYAGSGTTYTVTRVEFVNAGTFRVFFTPKAASIAGGSSIFVSSNLNKIFVRASLQIPANNVAVYLPPSSFAMYYFRQTKNTDALVSGFGMQTYNANNNLMFTTNKRILTLAAVGITPFYTNSNFTDPKTGDLYSVNYVFGSAPTNYAYYAPVVGRGMFNWNSSMTTGTGSVAAYTSGNGYGLSVHLDAGVRVVAGDTKYYVCKIGPHLGEQSSGATPLPNQVKVKSNATVMVIDTSKYQP